MVCKRGAALRDIEDNPITACARLMVITSDPDQKALLENVQAMWRALVYECDKLSEDQVKDLIQRIGTLQDDIRAMR